MANCLTRDTVAEEGKIDHAANEPASKSSMAATSSAKTFDPAPSDGLTALANRRHTTAAANIPAFVSGKLERDGLRLCISSLSEVLRAFGG